MERTVKPKYIITLALITLILAAPLLAGAELVSTDPAAPTPIEVIETGQAAWSAFAAGQWVLGLGLALTVLIQLFRAPWLGALVTRIPPRWRVAIPLALSGLASALLALAGEVPAELAALIWPATAGVAIAAHEVGEAARARRPRYRGGRLGLVSLAMGALLIGGCALRAPVQPLAAGLTTTPSGEVLRFDLARVADSGDLLTWCRARQERRWWSSALAQAAGVLAGGLAAAAVARDDDRLELSLEVGSLVSAGLAAGAQTYSSAQAGAYEQHCSGTGAM